MITEIRPSMGIRNRWQTDRRASPEREETERKREIAGLSMRAPKGSSVYGCCMGLYELYETMCVCVCVCVYTRQARPDQTRPVNVLFKSGERFRVQTVHERTLVGLADCVGETDAW